MPSPLGLLDLVVPEQLHALDNPPPCHGASKLARGLRPCGAGDDDDTVCAADVGREAEASCPFRPRKPVGISLMTLPGQEAL